MLLNNEHVSNLEASSYPELNSNFAAASARQDVNKMQEVNFSRAAGPVIENGKALRAIARVTDAGGQRVLGLIYFDQVIMCFSLNFLKPLLEISSCQY